MIPHLGKFCKNYSQSKEKQRASGTLCVGPMWLSAPTFYSVGAGAFDGPLPGYNIAPGNKDADFSTRCAVWNKADRGKLVLPPAGIFLVPARKIRKNRLKRGERCERCLWQMKRAERVAAVGR